MNAKSTSSQESKPSFTMDDFAHALEQYDYTFEKGQVVRGKVIQYTSDGAYVEIGGKSPGFVPLKEASIQPVTNLNECLPLQQEQDFLIISGPDAEGQLIISRRQLAIKQAWDTVKEISESGQSVQVRVTGTNRGGVTAEVEGLRAFIPRSHLVEKEDLDSLVGQLITANFIQIDQDSNKLVLSQRQLVRAAAIGKLTVGTLVEGKVAKIQPYGVFVDINGATGLLHITQVSGVHIDSLTTIFKIGQSIKVLILEIDEYKNRIALSTKVLESYPGEIVEKLDEVMASAEERLEQAREKLSQ
ncbi:S1 RNA-binding domain-containing protein [Gloeothece verrucosa]|uniref:RNA binding S1 domain protein n=1 Tax=Gloeothece verrucosa (strain PCC 7822) TaxID=497965 RepID=E0U8Y9_GLOV7|nr:S1 RNA-binding domain-containing protein [Gloeothece verrucosa]ADN16128.1 RNA binding S1 domain protein [Gloeothece verrucosa PCC 7822]